MKVINSQILPANYDNDDNNGLLITHHGAVDTIKYKLNGLVANPVLTPSFLRKKER